MDEGGGGRVAAGFGSGAAEQLTAGDRYPMGEPRTEMPTAAEKARRDSTDVAWPEVQRLYETTDRPVAEILRVHAITASQLRWRREKEGWKERPLRREAGDPVERLACGAAERLRRRMLGLYATLVSRLEAEVAKAETFDEGQARAHAALAAALPHLIGEREIMAKQISDRTRGKPAPKRETKNNDAGGNRLDDPDWVRAELTRRLDQISKRREPGRNPGDVHG